MKKNIFYIIGIVGIIKILLDGFDGEFYNPTIFKFIKWFIFTIYLVLLFIYHRKEN